MLAGTLLFIVVLWSWTVVYKMTKMGLIDDAINFIKSKVK